jgi:hypothetical protein
MSPPNALHYLRFVPRISRARLSSTRRSSAWIYARFTDARCVDRTFHGFVRMGNSSIAFVQSPEIGEIQPARSFNHQK